MTSAFFDHPILNSPYEYPDRHWELDAAGQPTGRINVPRRPASFITLTPIPKPKKQRGSGAQPEMVFDRVAEDLSSAGQRYDPTPIINDLRRQVELWRRNPDPSRWNVTPETARLLQHWRHHRFQDVRPFFCQVEAIETLIWLTEVAPTIGKDGRRFLDHLDAANGEANAGLSRLALKLATGAGKTTVMAILIAWKTISAGVGQVQIKGLDAFHPSTGEIRSDGPEGIACCFIDTDYDEESFFVRHAYFLGANDPYKALKTTLKAEIDEEAWSSLHSDTSRPFGKPKSGRIAVKVINHLGDEVMKVFRV